jgi:hypothetical protein
MCLLNFRFTAVVVGGAIATNGSATWRSSEAVSKIQKRSYLAKSLVVSSPRSGGLRQAT